eukprot:scpid53937/ scgid7888/ Katanin p80 WD40-containing subunit B1; p80 katanin
MANPSGKRSWKLQEFVAHGSSVNCLALGKNSGRILATGGEDRKVNVWAVGKPNCLMSLSSHTSPVDCVAFDVNEERLVSGSRSGTLKLYDLVQGKLVRTLPGHRSAISCLDFHPFGDFLASGSVDQLVKMWDVRRKGCIYSYKGHTDTIRCLQTSPDGKWVISGSDDGTAMLWDLTAGKLMHTFPHSGGAVQCLQFHPNDFLLATGSSDRCVRYWDLESFDLVSQSDPASSAVRCISYHPDGLCLFAGYKDLLRVYGWEPPTCRDSLAMPWGGVADMAASSNQLISASSFQTNISVWVVDMTKTRLTDDAPERPVTAQSHSTRKAFDRTAERSSTSAQPAKSSAAGDDESARHSPPPDDDGPPPGDVFAGKLRTARTPPRRAMEPFPAPSDGGASPPLPSRAVERPSSSGQNEAEGIDMLLKGHESLCKVIEDRQHHLKKVHSLWSKSEVKSSVSAAVSTRNPGVLVDILSIINLKPSLWSLGICCIILPALDELLKSRHETYHQCAASSIKLVLKHLAPMILTNINAPPTDNSDLAREERYQKSQGCWSNLKKLREVARTRSRETGTTGTQMKELHMAFTILDS